MFLRLVSRNYSNHLKNKKRCTRFYFFYDSRNFSKPLAKTLGFLCGSLAVAGCCRALEYSRQDATTTVRHIKRGSLCHINAAPYKGWRVGSEAEKIRVQIICALPYPICYKKISSPALSLHTYTFYREKNHRDTATGHRGL